MTTHPMRIELILLPISNIDAAIAFYGGRLGFHIDYDITREDAPRVVQLTPPGSSCSIMLDAGSANGGFTAMPPGAIKGIHLVVDDIAAVRERFLANGVAVGEVQEMSGVRWTGFSDPDGNEWVLQQLPPRT